MRSDNKTDKKELVFIENFLLEQYGESKTSQYYSIFIKLLNQGIDIRKTTQNIRVHNNYETKLQLLYFLFGLANSDYNLNDKEIANLKIISIHLGLSSDDFNSIQNLFITEIDACYKILEINPESTVAEIKTAYRKMVSKYHPDKNSNSGSIYFMAIEKFQKIQDAYSKLKIIRGIS